MMGIKERRFDLLPREISLDSEVEKRWGRYSLSQKSFEKRSHTPSTSSEFHPNFIGPCFPLIERSNLLGQESACTVLDFLKEEQ